MIMIDKLQPLIGKYNNNCYFKQDPISIVKRYKGLKDIEIAAVICSTLSFGNRQQIYKACKKTMDIMGNSPYKYLMDSKYLEYRNSDECWYRMLKMRDFAILCLRLKSIYATYNSMELLLLNSNDYVETLTNIFNGCNGIPKDNKSACKRLCLMLRWLVRQDGKVDIGIWKNLDQSKLLLPLDIHSLNTLRNLGVLMRKSNDRIAAIEATQWAKSFYPNDPAILDFFLFGESYERAHPEEFKEPERISMTNDQILLVATYIVIYVNELANVCVMDIKPSIANKDKETQKIYFAALKRVKEYQSRMAKIAGDNAIGIYASYCDALDQEVLPVIEKYRMSIEKYLCYIEGVENPYFLSMVELARSITNYSVIAISKRIAECLKFDENAVALRGYKQSELLKILEELCKWCFRKASDINYNESEECVNAYREFDAILTNPDIISTCIINANELENK